MTGLYLPVLYNKSARGLTDLVDSSPGVVAILPANQAARKNPPYSIANDCREEVDPSNCI